MPSTPLRRSRPFPFSRVVAPVALALSVGALVAAAAQTAPIAAPAKKRPAAAQAQDRSGTTEANRVWLAQPAEAAHIAAAEAKLAPLDIPGEPPIALSLAEWMKELKIPGLSVAVFDRNEILWAKAYGTKQAGGTDPVTLDTLFQAGSISKPVTAMAVLHFVEAGKWTLDENINDRLVSWKLPENEFTKTEKVTLRRLLSHSAGTTVHGFPGYAVGAPVPTVPQLLDGVKPANTAAVRVNAVPGSLTRYSGGGTTIAQLMMVDQLKKPFPRIMAETVIDPLGLRHSSYEQPLPPARAAMTATGTYRNGASVEGRWHIYPEMAAAGLWTTASDLARIAIEVSRANAGTSHKVLSQAMTRQMLTPQSDGFGIGFAVGPGARFGHNGADEGFQAYLAAFSDTGRGVVIMANSDNGSMLFDRLAASIAAEYGWRGFSVPDQPFITMTMLMRRGGADRTIAAYKAMKAAGGTRLDPGVLNGVGYNLLTEGRTADALKLFTANVELYPDDANAYDSLAEAQMKSGDTASAIANYRKTLQMEPKNENAIKQLEALGVKWTPEAKPQP